ncbi:MAG TPA: hypothetical protein VHH34_04595 [Pseudonocardiaceae bacterium]|nr:hypothetical protein [Pseudonocardiaceae bacterium]
MTATARRCLVVIGAAIAVTALCSISPEPARAGSGPAAAGDPLDGFTLGHLPEGLGPMVSDFDYEWDDVSFRTRVWERGPDPDGSYHVDLRAAVLRGDRLTDPDALRSFLAEYLERDPQQWELQRYDRATYHGFADTGRVFFLVRPGVAVQVATEEGSVVSRQELLATADGIEPAATAELPH